jgi:predicted transcriptional regulator
VSFMGELSDIGVADLLYLLALRRQTGKLAISANGDEINLFIDRGQLRLVTSSNMSLRLGRMLVQMNVLEPERLREVLQMQKQSENGNPLGHILLQHGYVTARQLYACVEEQCVAILARVIAADRGIFVYHRGVAISAQTEIVPLNSDRIVLEATRRTDELVTLRGSLPKANAPLMLATSIDNVADSLTDDEVFVAAALQAGASSLSELAPRLGIDEVAVWRTVVNMRERGLTVAGEETEAEIVKILPRQARQPALSAN